MKSGGCTWCGANDHAPFEHEALGRRLRWWNERYPFREPLDTRRHGTIITLIPREIERAGKRASKIVTEDISRGYRQYFDPGTGESRMDINIRGFGAELAGRRATNLELHWNYLPRSYRRRDKAADLGQRTEVRNARRAHGRLFANDHDPIDRVFLLVTGSMPTFDVRGWIEGVDLMVPEHWFEPPDVRYAGFFVDAADLNPLPLPEDA